MADIGLVIKIPETLKRIADEEDYRAFSHPVWLAILMESIQNGTPLPKGHDRLIEANSVDKIVKPIELSDAEWGMTAETAIRLIHDTFDRAPTIIEADSEAKKYAEIAKAYTKGLMAGLLGIEEDKESEE